jgi:hypothetical protein
MFPAPLEVAEEKDMDVARAPVYIDCFPPRPTGTRSTHTVASKYARQEVYQARPAIGREIGVFN